jgi:hypothetical protein
MAVPLTEVALRPMLLVPIAPMPDLELLPLMH